MWYISTRGNFNKVKSAEAINMGMVPVGGLFVPEEIPAISLETIKGMQDNTYQEIAKIILDKFLTDFTEEEINDCINSAYNIKNFDSIEIAPLKKLNSKLNILELWHGPTAAFKDMALQIMPYFLQKSKEKVESKNETVILVATSGDTGKAALEGFKNIPGIKIIVFYPEEGVSEVQKLQMNTTDGDNTFVVALKGNFDDCQTGVKEIFGNEEIKKILDENGYQFSSANSINWGRLLPQIIYYFAAYANLLKYNEINAGEKVNFSVPTGNFGNILAGYYAKQMGLPINKLICASNKNNVLTDFFKTGKYDRNRSFYKTMSPSMDILISSNLERFLFEVTGHNGEKLSKWYKELQENGIFEVDSETKTILDELVIAEYTDEENTLKTIKSVYEKYDYVIDTHTAVAVDVLNNIDVEGKIVVDSTASPYKFSSNVLQAIVGNISDDEFESVEEISEISRTEIHRAVKGLKEKEILHNKIIVKEEMIDVIKEILEIKE